MRRFHYEQLNKWVPDADPVVVEGLLQNELVRPTRKSRLTFNLIQQLAIADEAVSDLFQNPIIRPLRKKRFNNDFLLVPGGLVSELVVAQNPLVRPGRRKFVIDYFVGGQDFPYPTPKAVFVAFTGINPQVYRGTL